MSVKQMVSVLELITHAKRILICGDRKWNNTRTMQRVFELFDKEATIIQGGCRGADLMAEAYAKGFEMDYMGFPARWKREGKKAGPIRNSRQLKIGEPEIAIGFHNDIQKSKGTKDMLTKTFKAGIPTFVVNDACEIRLYKP